MVNKKESCPHLEECSQQILEGDACVCEERIDNEWSFGDCFKYGDLASNVPVGKNMPTKTPKEWLKQLEEKKDETKN